MDKEKIERILELIDNPMSKCVDGAWCVNDCEDCAAATIDEILKSMGYHKLNEEKVAEIFISLFPIPAKEYVERTKVVELYNQIINLMSTPTNKGGEG